MKWWVHNNLVDLLRQTIIHNGNFLHIRIFFCTGILIAVKVSCMNARQGFKASSCVCACVHSQWVDSVDFPGLPPEYVQLTRDRMKESILQVTGVV